MSFKQVTKYKSRLVSYEDGRDLGKDQLILGKTFVMEPFQWEHGWAIAFSMVYGIREFIETKTGVRHIEYEKQLYRQCFYDNKHPDKSAILGALGSGQVNGVYANNMVYDLFYSLILEPCFHGENNELRDKLTEFDCYYYEEVARAHAQEHPTTHRHGDGRG